MKRLLKTLSSLSAGAVAVVAIVVFGLSLVSYAAVTTFQAVAATRSIPWNVHSEDGRAEPVRGGIAMAGNVPGAVQAARARSRFVVGAVKTGEMAGCLTLKQQAAAVLTVPGSSGTLAGPQCHSPPNARVVFRGTPAAPRTKPPLTVTPALPCRSVAANAAFPVLSFGDFT